MNRIYTKVIAYCLICGTIVAAAYILYSNYNQTLGISDKISDVFVTTSQCNTASCPPCPSCMPVPSPLPCPTSQPCSAALQSSKRIQCGHLPDAQADNCAVPQWIEFWQDSSYTVPFDQMDICSFLNLRCRFPTYFAGITDFSSSQADRMFIDLLFNRYPKLANITEFGTFHGATALLLGLTARVRGGRLHTYDYIDVRHQSVKDAWLPEMTFYRENLLLAELSSNAIKSLQRQNQFAFMDNGKKKYEVETYARYMPVGSILTTHDWNNEVGPDVELVLHDLGFRRELNDFAVFLGSHVRAWKRIQRL